MGENNFTIRVGVLGGIAAVIVLLGMIAVGAGITDLSALEHSYSPALVSALFAAHGKEIQNLMVLDDLFVASYLVAFVGLFAYVRPRSPLLATVGLVMALATAGLDFFENSITLALVGDYGVTQAVNAGWLFGLSIAGQMKYLASSCVVAFLGAGIWSGGRLNRIVTFIFMLFLPINVLAFINTTASTLVILWMMAMLILGVIVMGRARADG